LGDADFFLAVAAIFLKEKKRNLSPEKGRIFRSNFGADIFFVFIPIPKKHFFGIFKNAKCLPFFASQGAIFLENKHKKTFGFFAIYFTISIT
jgi:hypothetical protein